jgi:hypothetical protein
MADGTFYTPRKVSAEVLRGFARALVAALPDKQVVSAHVSTNLRRNHVPISNGRVGDVLNPFVDALLPDLAKLDFLHIEELQVALSGVVQGQTAQVTYRERANTLGAEVEFKPAEQWELTVLETAVAAMNTEFGLRRQDTLQLESASAADRDALRAHQGAAAELAQNVSRLGIVLKQEEEQWSEFLRVRLDELERMYQEKNASLAQEHAAREAKLEAESKRLKEWEASIDARDRTTTRRDLLQKIKDILDQQKAVTLSTGTVRKRTVITTTCLAAMAVGLSLAGLGAYEAANTQLLRWSGTLAAGTLLFASTLVFFLRWSDAWFRDHARFEMQAMRNHADILRASWVAELYFEWLEEEKGDFPEALTEHLTRNLFANGADPGVSHPMEDVLGVLKGLRVKSGKLEIETGKKRWLRRGKATDGDS